MDVNPLQGECILGLKYISKEKKTINRVSKVLEVL